MLNIEFCVSDISGQNLAFTAHRLSELSLDGILEVLGKPQTEALVRRDGQALIPGMPEQLVKATGWDSWIDEDEEDVRLIDFGEAFTQNAIPTELAEPSGLQVPEKIFTGKFDYRVDLWRAGCLVRTLPGDTLRRGLMRAGQIYTLVIGTRPFQWLWDMDRLVAQMIHFVEELPSEWRPEWERMKIHAGRKYEDTPGMIGHPQLIPTTSSQLEFPNTKLR